MVDDHLHIPYPISITQSYIDIDIPYPISPIDIPYRYPISISRSYLVTLLAGPFVQAGGQRRLQRPRHDLWAQRYEIWNRDAGKAAHWFLFLPALVPEPT
jgi:hypothetical protein